MKGRKLGRTRRILEDNIRLHLREVGWEDVKWIYLAQDKNQWRALLDTVMNLGVP
jgi:hypothetical protein